MSSEGKEFERFNKRIDEVAEANPGYIGRKRWSGEDGLRAVTYYWQSREDLHQFQSNPVHKEAKSRYAEWYAGYRVEISEVVEIYGDGELDAEFPV